MMESGVPIDRYVAYEYDETSVDEKKGRPYGWAALTASHNFPFIEQRGDVFKADFTEFEGFDWLVGGSPCTYWSIAQKNNRETEASGMGWELFQQYVRALREAKPKYFIYENNKSMSKAIRESITEAFGFEPVLINSALVSAQNRQRLYWVGRRNDDGTYSKVDVPQPQDRGILLKDILEDGCCVDKDKAYCLKHQAGNARDYFKKHHTQIKFEPVFIGEVPEHKGTYRNGKQASQQYRVYDTNAKGVAVTTCAITNVAEPVRVGCMPSPDGEVKGSQAMRVYDSEGKSVNLSANGGGAGGKTGLYAIQCCPMRVKEATKKGFTEIEPGDCVDMTQPNSKTRRGRSMRDKSNCLMTSNNYYQYCGCIGYAMPCEWDKEGRPIKAKSCADGKIYTVYEVKDGKITIKGKQYPIKLVDGFYIIRKLTVRECMRLQTVPEWYEFPVSDSQAYKMLGNGWTVAVISWLIHCVFNNER